MGILFFKRFTKEKRGDVVHYILVLSVIVVIAAFAFPKIKTASKDSTEQSTCHMDNLMKDASEMKDCTPKNTGGTQPPSGDNSGGGSGSGGGTATPIYRSCLETLEHNSSLADGIYPIKLSDGSVKNMPCDMKNGGWTLVSNYDYSQDKTPPAGSSLVAKDPFISASYTGTAPEGWYPHFTLLSNGKMQYTNFYSNKEGIPYSNVKIDMKVNFMWTVDSFGNTHGSPPNRMSLDGQYVDGISVTTGAEGNRKHILTATLSTVMPTDERKDFIKGDTITGATINKAVTKSVPTTNEKIETRVILDQTWQDENIGIQKYIVWVK